MKKWWEKLAKIYYGRRTSIYYKRREANKSLILWLVYASIIGVTSKSIDVAFIMLILGIGFILVDYIYALYMDISSQNAIILKMLIGLDDYIPIEKLPGPAREQLLSYSSPFDAGRGIIFIHKRTGVIGTPMSPDFIVGDKPVKLKDLTKTWDIYVSTN